MHKIFAVNIQKNVCLLLRKYFHRFNIIICITVVYDINCNGINIFYDIVLCIYIACAHKIIVYLHRKSQISQITKYLLL
jgi:hypothetical protein